MCRYDPLDERGNVRFLRLSSFTVQERQNRLTSDHVRDFYSWCQPIILRGERETEREREREMVF
jgi:hypothetical protein